MDSAQLTPPRSLGLRRFAFRSIILLGLGYVGVVIVFTFLERGLVFRPSLANQSWNPPIDPDTQDTTITLRDAPPIHAWWLPPRDAAAGAILLAHGNGGNLSHRGQFAADLRRTLGTGVLMFDYPGYGKSEGKPSEAACYAAAEAAYNWLTTEAKIPRNRIVLLGESLGGGPAVELATHHEHRAIVLLFTFTSLPAAAKVHYPWLPTHTFMKYRFDNLAKIGQCPRPIFIAHGMADEVVPFAHGEALFAAANAPKEFLRVQGAGHGYAEVGPHMLAPLATFLSKHAP
jgi:fermentation-respiration switch protein FrsA (DUF1100 family)